MRSGVLLPRARRLGVDMPRATLCAKMLQIVREVFGKLRVVAYNVLPAVADIACNCTAIVVSEAADAAYLPVVLVRSVQH